VPNVWEGVQQHVWWLWFALYDSLPSLKQLSDESWNQLNPQVQTFNITMLYEERYDLYQTFILVVGGISCNTGTPYSIQNKNWKTHS